eukprot:gene24192-44877_t
MLPKRLHVMADRGRRQRPGLGVDVMLNAVVVDALQRRGCGFRHVEPVRRLHNGVNRQYCWLMFENLTSKSLPSLNALRAFEAMARTGRVTLAAEELHVTHSAVSRQVKALELTLGVRLFSGPKNRLELTPAGRELAPALTEAFDQIASAVRRTRTG